MGRVLGGSQDQVARQLTGRLLCQQGNRKWEYTSAEAERSESGFEMMETHIWKIHNTIAQYIATRSLMDLCEATETNQVVWVGMLWWEHAVIALAGSREKVVMATEAYEDGMEE